VAYHFADFSGLVHSKSSPPQRRLRSYPSAPLPVHGWCSAYGRTQDAISQKHSWTIT
jgi:hypothetical protein